MSQWEERPQGGTDERDATERIQVLRLRPGDRVEAVLLGDLLGRRLHYCDGTYPCAGDGCRYCESPDPKVAKSFRRWYGPGARRGATWHKVIVELTDENEQALRGHELIGLMIELYRAATPRSHLAVKISHQKPLDKTARERAAAMSFDVKPVLMRLWGAGARPATCVDHVDPRVLKFPKREAM